MCFYIGIEDLAANALIELIRKCGEDNNFVTYQEIENYGSQVAQILNEKGEMVVLILSRENTNTLFRDYSEFFEEKVEKGERGVALKAGIGINDLIIKFRGYLALDVLLAFVNERCISVLGG